MSAPAYNRLRVFEALTANSCNSVDNSAGEVLAQLVRKTGRVSLVGNFSGLMNLGDAEEATYFSVLVNPTKYSLALDFYQEKS